MFDNSERKQERLNSGLPDFITTNTYNLIIGLVVLYGFVVNAIMVATCSKFFAQMNPIVFLIAYFVLCFLGVFITNSSNPIASFIGYNFVVVPIGAVVSICVPQYSSDLVLSAIIVTGIVVAVMLILATAFPKVFEKMGSALLVALLISTVAELVSMLFGYGGDVFNWIFVVIFSLYIGYDWHKAQVYPKTLDNAVDSALDIYLDIINLFIRLLRIMGRKKR